MRHYRSFLIFALFSGAAFAATTEKQYFAIFLDGHKVGHSIHTRAVSDAKVTTTETVNMTITRSGVEMSISQTESSVETPDGKPLAFESVSELGGMKQVVKGKIDAGGKAVITSGMGQALDTQTIDWPQGALMSEGIMLLQKKAGLAPDTALKAKVFSPSTTSAVDTEMKVGQQEKIDLLGRVVMLTKVETVMHLSESPYTSTSYVDANLVPQKTIMPVLGMNIELVACDRHFALSKNDVVDFLDKSMIPCPVSLKDGASAKSITYKFQPIGSAKLSFPTTDMQSVAIAPDGVVTLTIKPVSAAKGQTLPYSGTDPNALAALKTSRYAQSDRKEVIALARQAVGDTKDAADAAKKIESFVHKYITEKDFNVGYASAAEVVQGREGDCTEHAVLAAALCKAAGIPAQVVFGVLYVDQFDNRTDVFVGHAWTRVFIKGKWIDLDATRHAVGPTRIAMAVGDGNPDQFFGILGSFGNFKIVSAIVEK